MAARSLLPGSHRHAAFPLIFRPHTFSPSLSRSPIHQFYILARPSFAQSRFQSVSIEPQQTPTSSPPPPPTTDSPQRPPRKSLVRRFFTTTALVVVFFGAGFAMSAAPAYDAVNDFISPPTDAETLGLYEPQTPTAAQINDHILRHPLAAAFRNDPRYTETRPHMKIPPAMRPHNFTAGTLLGTDMIEVPPLAFVDAKSELPSMIQIYCLGPALCGHPGIVHGGLLATLLDEGLARACFPALPNKVGVTASLNITYKKPCPAGAYVVLRAETTKVDGRKAWVKGTIEVLGEGTEVGEPLVEAEALFIEPRGAKNMARIYSTQ